MELDEVSTDLARHKFPLSEVRPPCTRPGDAAYLSVTTGSLSSYILVQAFHFEAHREIMSRTAVLRIWLHGRCLELFEFQAPG